MGVVIISIVVSSSFCPRPINYIEQNNINVNSKICIEAVSKFKLNQPEKTGSIYSTIPIPL